MKEGHAVKVGYVLGVDFSSYEAVLVGLPADRAPKGDDEPIVETVVFRPKKAVGADGAYAALKTARMALMRSKLYWQANVVFVERGFGASRQSDFIMGAFYGILVSTFAQVAETNEMLAAEWKREISAACGITTKQGRPGNGNLSKVEAHVFVKTVALNARHDVDGYGPDALDAYGIATVGRWLCERAARELS